MYSTKTCKKDHFHYFWNFGNIKSKKSKKFALVECFAPLRNTFVQSFKKNGQRMKEEWWFEGYFFKKRTKNTVFWPGFWKKDLQIATPHSPLDSFSWKFAQRYLSRVQKIWWEQNFEFFIFFAIYSPKTFKNGDFRYFWNFDAL